MSGYGLAGLDATDAELADLADVLTELGDADGLGEMYDDGPADPDGYELEDALAAEVEAAEAELSNSGYDLSQLADVGATIDLSTATAAQRHAEDAQGMPAETEARTAHLLSRVERGTYTPPQHDDASGSCGPRDDFGRCAARYHDAGCLTVLAAEAANGSAESALAWRQQLLSNHGSTRALQLANEQLAVQDESAGAAIVRSSAAYQGMRGILGIGR